MTGPDVPEVPGYTLERRLGSGGQGHVWAATSAAGDGVAIKVLTTSEAIGRREAEALRRLRHPHLVRLREVVTTTAGQSALVLDRISGGCLATLVQARGSLEPGEVVTVLTPLASLLAHLHEQGVVHGDVTPGNVLFGQDGRPMLCDLGIVRPAGLEPREHGTLGYLDEAGEGPSSDIFALAAVAWFALTGQAPASAALRPPLVALKPAVPVALAALIDRCLQVEVSERPTAAELAVAAFDACAAEAVRLLNTDPEADPVQTVTHRLRRREAHDSWEDIVSPGLDPAGVSLDELLAPASTPTAAARTAQSQAQSQAGNRTDSGRARPRIDRQQLRRAPAAPPPRRGPARRHLVTAAVVVASGLLAGGAAALYLRPDSPPLQAAAKAAGQQSSSATATAAPSASPTVAAGSGVAADSEAELVKAVQDLSGQRAAAFNSGDPAGLRTANAPESPSLAADLAALEQITSQGLQLRGVAFELTDVTVVDADATQATVTMTARTGAHDVVDSHGVVVSSVPAAAGRPVTVHLVRAADDWRVETVA